MNATPTRTTTKRASRDRGGETLPARDRLVAALRAVGIEGVLATRLASAARAAEGTETQKLRAAVEEIVATAPLEITEDAPRPRVVAVVGPSGVGKTTTVAKLAARARLDGKTVALVACDGFRVGAVDQLERYAELLGAEMFTAKAPVELAEVLDDLLERPEGPPDVVFVDTSGRPPTTQSPEHALAGWITRARREHGDDDDGPTLEVLLCVAAGARAADVTKVVATFAPVAPTAVVVTKTDETCAPGALVHAPALAKRPLALVCNGPRVPEDVRPADAEVVASLLVGVGASNHGTTNGTKNGTRKERTS